MLPQLINHYHSRPTRDNYTNFPNSLLTVYNNNTPKKYGKSLILPPINSIINNSTASKLKKSIDERLVLKNIEKNKSKREIIFKGKTAEIL